jgi:predicted phage terminase large subunit-like protein
MATRQAQPQHRIQLTEAQAAFRRSSAPYRGFVGGRGAGKSFVGTLDLLLRASAAGGAGRTFLACAPTYVMLRDSTLSTFRELGERLGLVRAMNKSELKAILANGAAVIFRSTDEPERLRGPNLSGAFLDEASLMSKDAFSVAIACLREGGRQGWLSACFTPRGRAHWSYEVFGTGKPDTALFRSRTTDNPFLPADFAERLRGQYTSFLSRQELEGEFLDPEGALFRRSWFPIVESAPAGLSLCRSWDLAASAPKPGRDPDWTCGVLLARLGRQGDFFVLDVRRVRTTPQEVERLVVQTASLDGKTCAITMEQEPGSSGVALCDRYARLLAGYRFKAVRSTGDKATRAMPLASAAEAGLVKLVRGPWNNAFLDEFESFPVGDHDDQVDATAGAFARLAERRAFTFWC